MIDFSWFTATSWSLVWQSTLCLAIGGVASLILARRPARAHGVLVAAMLATLTAPLGTFLIRQQGWGMLPSQDHGAAIEPLSLADRLGQPVRRSTDGLSTSATENAIQGFTTSDSSHVLFSPSTPDAARPAPVSRAALDSANSSSGELPGMRSGTSWDRAKTALEEAPVGHALLGGWLVLSTLAFIRLAISFWAGVRLVAHATRLADAPVVAVLSLAAVRLGLPTGVTARLSSEVRCPVIWCWSRRPIVLFPPSFLERTSESAWLAICCHELAHWKRRDHVTMLLGQSLCCVLPWQPLAWWARGRREQLSELACDEWVVASGHLPETYAEALIDLAPQRKPGLALAVVRSRSGLRGRIQHLLRIQVARPSLGKRWLTALAALTLGLVSIVALAQQKPPADDDAAVPPANEKAESAPAAAKPPAAGSAGAGAFGRARASTTAQSAEGLLRVTGKVVMPDGSPAAGATVISRPEQDKSAIVARADASGRFELQDMFGTAVQLYVTSADGNYQTVNSASAASARTLFASPIEIKLAPAKVHEVIVRSEGKPVEGAHVAASGSPLFQVAGVTDTDGKVRLLIPAAAEISTLAAWHPKLGVDGLYAAKGRPTVDMSQLSLRTPTLRTVKVVDAEGKGVGGLDLAVDFRTTDEGWSGTSNIYAAFVRTDADGTAPLPWAPLENFAGMEVELFDSDWKVNSIDQGRAAPTPTTVHAVRKGVVEGRLTMPAGKSAEGILVTGFGFGPGSDGDIPYARARRDGTFSVQVAPDHGYVLTVCDLEWASNPWPGVPLTTDGGKPAEIAIDVYPATPVTIHLTRGADHDPVAGAAIIVGSPKAQVKYRVNGVTRTGSATVEKWVGTDADGRARTGAGVGEMNVRVVAGNWQEERKIPITSQEPVNVEFYRPWSGDRKLSVRLTLDAKAFPAPASLVTRASSPRGNMMPLEFYPKVNADGTVQVSFDAASLSLLVVDGEKGYSGFATVGAEESEIEIALQPTATIGGTLLNAAGKPLVGWTLCPRITNYFYLNRSQPTDEAGRFRLSGIPGDFPFQLLAEDETRDPDRSFVSDKRTLLPSEARLDDVVQDDRRVPALLSLAENVGRTCRSAALCRMRGLMILQGDDSPGVAELTSAIGDFDQFKVVLRYLPLEVAAEERNTEAKALNAYGWPRPAVGEVVLVVLDGDQKAIAAERIASGDPAAALKGAATFLETHKPPTRDAVALAAEATKVAEASGRRLWIVEGGPRCGPCFRLARWMDDHHALLEKDYVVVKLMDGLDENVGVVLKKLGHGDSGTIPWYAITETDGTILFTSKGMPSSVEGIRQFRQMLERTVRSLKPAEVDELVDSLSSEK